MGYILFFLLFFYCNVAIADSGKSVEKEFFNSIGMHFLLIESGSFIMGTPEGEPGHDFSEEQHPVKIERPFYMQKTEVTQRQWKEVMGYNPSFFNNCGDNCPVENVSFEEVKEFIRRLNERENTKRYRLPTEAEWEYACRAGTNTAFNNGGILEGRIGFENDWLNEIAWYYHNSKRGTHPVAQKAPNQWGLYDMHGNVWEWCEDWYAKYPFQERSNSKGPETGWSRIRRGGSWRESPLFCRAGYRSSIRPEMRDSDTGFRLVADVVGEPVLPNVPEAPPKAERGPVCIASKVVLFDLDKADIRPDMVPILDEVVLMAKERDAEIHLSGHTCDLASDEYNIRLSKRRADSVIKYLVDKGVPEKRIYRSYYGEERPREPNTDEEHRSLNRRVEIRIFVNE